MSLGEPSLKQASTNMSDNDHLRRIRTARINLQSQDSDLEKILVLTLSKLTLIFNVENT